MKNKDFIEFLISIAEARLLADKCPKCAHQLQDAPGIGLYCPSKACDVIDGPVSYIDSLKSQFGKNKVPKEFADLLKGLK